MSFLRKLEIGLNSGLWWKMGAYILLCRAECTCTPVHTFVILSMQRSGSGWFETLLNSHPNISSHGEVFSAAGRRENFTIITETLESVFNLDWMSSAAKNECTSTIGLKWMLNQVKLKSHDTLYYLQTILLRICVGTVLQNQRCCQ